MGGHSVYTEGIGKEDMTYMHRGYRMIGHIIVYTEGIISEKKLR